MFAGSRFLLPDLRTVTLVPKPGRKEAGTGEHLNHFNNQINKHKIKAAAPHGWLPHTKHKLKSRPGPLSSFTVVTPHLTLPKLLRWVAQVSFIIIYSTSLAPFPRLSAPGTRHTHQYKPDQPGVCDHVCDIWRVTPPVTIHNTWRGYHGQHHCPSGDVLYTLNPTLGIVLLMWGCMQLFSLGNSLHKAPATKC